MRIIDRYVLRMFVKVLAICFVSLAGLYVIIDMFSNLDDFISFGKREGNLLVVLGQYYGARVLSFFDRMSGVLALISCMFCITLLERNQEMTALLAAGISKRRIVMPLIVAACLVSIGGAISRETVIPSLRDSLTRSAQDWNGEKAKPFTPRMDNQTDILLRGKNMVMSQKRIEKPSFQLVSGMGDYGYLISAEEAYYQPENEQHSAGYLLKNVEQPADSDELESALLKDRTIVYSPKDHDWLKPGECFVASDVAFDQLEGGAAWRQYSSTQELIEGLSNQSLGFGADVRVTIHARFVQPLIDITLLFLGLPIIMQRGTRNIFLAIAQSLGIMILFFGVVLASQGLGMNTLFSPAFAAWCPLLIFVPVTVAMSEPLRQ